MLGDNCGRGIETCGWCIGVECITLGSGARQSYKWCQVYDTF